jgi:pyruvate/2-oxoacid:ferredoxin oxidoreductase alpha subunit
MEDAEVALLVSGAVSSTAKEVVDSLRAQKKRVGLIQVRLFRPFPTARLRSLLQGIPKIAVIDRNCSYGHHGIFFQELKSALYHVKRVTQPEIYGYVMGLGGRDIDPQSLREVVRMTQERERPEPETVWLGSLLPSEADLRSDEEVPTGAREG